jgi:pilus assembly protein CpaB
VVPPGKRAMTVRVNDVVGVAGFALPGTTVDVLVNTQHEGGRRGDVDRAVSKIVLERILVLAVAQEADRDTSRPKVVSAVTLEVTPDQAEKLDLARSVGTLSLVLRNPADPQDAATVGATKAALLGDVATVALAPSARQRTVTRGLSNPQAKPARTGSSATPPSGKGVGASTTSAPSLTHDPVPDLEVRAVAALAPAPVETVTATPPKTCVEILAGATRRTECF